MKNSSLKPHNSSIVYSNCYLLKTMEFYQRETSPFVEMSRWKEGDKFESSRINNE